MVSLVFLASLSMYNRHHCIPITAFTLLVRTVTHEVKNSMANFCPRSLLEVCLAYCEAVTLNNMLNEIKLLLPF